MFNIIFNTLFRKILILIPCLYNSIKSRKIISRINHQFRHMFPIFLIILAKEWNIRLLCSPIFNRDILKIYNVLLFHFFIHTFYSICIIWCHSRNIHNVTRNLYVGSFPISVNKIFLPLLIRHVLRHIILLAICPARNSFPCGKFIVEIRAGASPAIRMERWHSNTNLIIFHRKVLPVHLPAGWASAAVQCLNHLELFHVKVRKTRLLCLSRKSG